MTSNQRIDEFLKLQDKGISLDEIASTLGIKPQTLKRDLNKNGYKSVKGKYIKRDEKSQNVSIQVSFVDNELNQKNNEKKAKKKTKIAEQSNKNEKVKVKNTKTSKTKKDKKINLTQEDLDKLCEVYDWYLEIKDCKSLKPKKTKKEIVVDFEKTEDKTVSMKVDKGVWEDFLRLCSNTSHDRKTLVTQALSDFMKVHKDLL